MSKQDEAGLILKLYELRREETMRKAREWFFREFNPQSLADYNATMFSEHGAYVRMIVSYWDMAAALVNNGAIGLELFNETNGEYLSVFAQIEPLLGEIRSAYTPRYAASLEKLVDASPEGRKRVAEMREAMKGVRERFAAKQAAARRA